MKLKILLIFIYTVFFGQLLSQNEINSVAEANAEIFLTKQLGKKTFDKHIQKQKVFKHSMLLITYKISCKNCSKGKNMIVIFVEDKSKEVDTILSMKEIKNARKVLSGKLKCDFRINEEDAIRISKQNGIKDGIKAWNIGLICFGGECNDIRWSITNTEYERHGGSYQASGQSIVIETLTGKYSAGGWNAIE